MCNSSQTPTKRRDVVMATPMSGYPTTLPLILPRNEQRKAETDKQELLTIKKVPRTIKDYL